MRLKGRMAIVTGGGRGIGEAISRCLVEDGARVGILDIDGDVASNLAAELGPEHIGMGADIANEAITKAAIDEVVDTFGGLDILVNNAGGGNRKTSMANGQPFTNILQEGWDEEMAINLRTTFCAAKAAIPHLKQRGGAIVNISSISALAAAPAKPAYAAAKAGVLSLTRSLALELGPDGIRVNAICPGFIYTRAWKALSVNIQKSTGKYAGKDPYEVYLEEVREKTPLGRPQTVEDIGKLAAFFCSDDAFNITGQIVSVDGGLTL